MNLFDRLVTEALKTTPSLAPLRVVVEKELLHHDIIRIMRDYHFTKNLTFIGGTALRTCYGGIRLSEDLDFTGGISFSRSNLSDMGRIIIEILQAKYGLNVTVSEPVRDTQNVDTWKIKIETRPESRNLPSQRINIDICALPSYEQRPMMLINQYGADMGTSGLIIQVQSCEEIYADKLIAFALRPNRIKYRDLWDMVWLSSKGLKPRLELIPYKLRDREYNSQNFLKLFEERMNLLKENSELEIEFNKEMSRFLPMEEINKIIKQDGYWAFIIYLMSDLYKQINQLFRD